MDIEHCVIAELIRICEIHTPQIKRRYNVFYMSCRPPLALAGFGVNDDAKIQLFRQTARKNDCRILISSKNGSNSKKSVLWEGDNITKFVMTSTAADVVVEIIYAYDNKSNPYRGLTSMLFGPDYFNE